MGRDLQLSAAASVVHVLPAVSKKKKIEILKTAIEIIETHAERIRPKRSRKSEGRPSRLLR